MVERRILLAEPDAIQAERLTKMLQAMQYTVEPAESGLAALQRLQDASTPEMALLNANLPLLNGVEVALEVRRRARRHQLWLMLMSEKPSAEQVAMAHDAGMDEFLATPVSEAELRMRIRTGERVLAVYHELADAAATREFHATHDPLTGAWRREAMLDLLFQETDRVQRLRTPLSLLLLDVDRFSALNQRHGCVLGDKVLPLLISRIRNQLRSYDMLGRVDEDEFLLALPGCVLAHAEQQANRLRQSIARRPFVVDGVDVQITVSIGVAESLGRSPLVVLREAERALALAKQNGRNCAMVYTQTAAMQVQHPESRRKIGAGTSA